MYKARAAIIFEYNAERPPSGSIPEPSVTAVAKGYSMVLRCCSARDAPMAVSTFFTSSGGGSTAGMPSASMANSRHQPLV
ncbi:hypothetical protein D3C71_2085920 [compost metagenome]